MVTPTLGPFAWTPRGPTLTRVVALQLAVADEDVETRGSCPSGRGCAAAETKATYRPSALTADDALAPFAAAERLETLTRAVLFGRTPLAGMPAVSSRLR